MKGGRNIPKPAGVSEEFVTYLGNCLRAVNKDKLQMCATGPFTLYSPASDPHWVASVALGNPWSIPQLPISRKNWLVELRGTMAL
jgi:hypothetical protein